MEIIKSEAKKDGSSWDGIIEIKGIRFGANFVAGRFSVFTHSSVGKHRRIPKWARLHVSKWAQKEVEALPCEWHQNHKSLYEI